MKRKRERYINARIAIKDIISYSTLKQLMTLSSRYCRRILIEEVSKEVRVQGRRISEID